MFDYDENIVNEAISFVKHHKNDLIGCMIDSLDFDENNIDWLRDSFYKEVTCRNYTTVEATHIIKHCHNKEKDSDRWLGMTVEDALKERAALSHSNDVWDKCERMYSEIMANFGDACLTETINGREANEMAIINREWNHVIRKTKNRKELQ